MSNFDEASRTFETRVLFIKEIFANKYTQSDIMAHCIQHKLDESLKKYIKELEKHAWNLNGKDPMDILKKID